MKRSGSFFNACLNLYKVTTNLIPSQLSFTKGLTLQDVKIVARIKIVLFPEKNDLHQSNCKGSQ